MNPRNFVVAILITVFILTPMIQAQAMTGNDYPPWTVQVGGKAKTAVMKDSQGNNVSLSQFNGKVVLLSFWDCYTDVCFTSVRAIEDMVRKYPREDFVFITVCCEVASILAADNHRNVMKSCGTGQIILLDPNKSVGSLYNVLVKPTTFLIDREQNVLRKIHGLSGLRDPEFIREVEKLVGTTLQLNTTSRAQ